MDINSYLDFAENDYQFFKANYKEGWTWNSMAAVAQNACEKYLKHLIVQYDHPQTSTEIAVKSNMLRAHSLSKLCNYIENHVCTIDNDTRDTILKADGYYFTVRYPGDDSFEVSSNDIRRCNDALEGTRDFAYSVIMTFEKQAEQAKETVRAATP